MSENKLSLSRSLEASSGSDMHLCKLGSKECLNPDTHWSSRLSVLHLSFNLALLVISSEACSSSDNPGRDVVGVGGITLTAGCNNESIEDLL